MSCSQTDNSRREIYRIESGKCISCGACAVACPESAIIIQAEGRRAIVPEKCSGCGLCVGRCIGLAIGKKQYTRSIV